MTYKPNAMMQMTG